jgi:UDP-3-O-[3-hydroxymyristoyl] glucosamine N-acyltransferase
MTIIERIRLGDLAARLGCELHGDPELEITGVAGVERQALPK